MDDNELCPLCCEELDMSDRQFFPCKCGYQVCMWCWHRIKESESGLCPACRTPYGDDPHEFSAVDMEEVVKANKEKAAAEKREKERLRQQQAAAAGGGAGAGIAGMHIGGGSDGDLAVATAGGSRGLSEPPKDRNQLANMRVIRRNLVYAVGLPPSIATEEILRKPEHFGQYGKIAKIVLNRNHNANGDPRRASASAYVTFAHKEDALACILALDGFYLDARNIRASYGTSKYCSAFIKNVRCNNPECTYLHCMGDAEDMFTKQEIQAGYVTSGRDVLAKQQQLAAVASAGSRRKVGGGGPSGTGKASPNPVFPPPTYEENNKSQSSLVPPPPPPTSSTALFPPVSSSIQRTQATNVISGFSVAAAGKMARSSSLPNPTTSQSTLQTSSVASVSSQGSNKSDASSLTPAEMLSRQQEQLRKMHPQNISTPSANSGSNSSTAQATAASVVAGVHSTNRVTAPPPAPHTTLTALTPLKRSASVPEKNKQTWSNSNDPVVDGSMKLSSLKNTASNTSTITNSPTSLSSTENGPIGASAIGGTVIGGGLIGSIGSRSSSLPIGGPRDVIGKAPMNSSINNNIVGGNTIGNFSNQGNNAVLGSDLFSPSLLSGGSDMNQWGFGTSNNNNGSDRLFGGTDNFGTIGGQGIWGNESAESTIPSAGFSSNSNRIGNISNNGFHSSTPIGNDNSMNMSGSSALASMLGIQLPTGVGTLRDSLWASSTPVRAPQTAMKSNAPAPNPIGSGIKKNNEGVILGGGQFPMGGMQNSNIGTSTNSTEGNTSDIKLLQSLLPGVHITSGNAYQPAAPSNIGGLGWGGFGPTQTNSKNYNTHSQPQGHHHPIGVGSLMQKSVQLEQTNDMWGGSKIYSSDSNSVIGGNKNQQPNGSNIW